MKITVQYVTKKREYLSNNTYRYVYALAEVEPLTFMRNSCGTGAAANRYYYDFFFIAPNDAEFVEKHNGSLVCRGRVNRQINRRFNPKNIVWVGNIGYPLDRIPDELHGYEDPEAEGGYSYPCNRCGENAPIICEPVEFNPDNHFCGSSWRCLP